MSAPTVLHPESTSHVSALLERGTAINGGTDLLVQMRAGRQLATVVDLSALRVPVAEPAAGGLVLSALAPLSDLIAVAPTGLEAALHQFASTTIRNRATIGGNLATGSPAADVVPSLVAAGARVRVREDETVTEIPITEFLLGPRRVALDVRQWVHSVRLPEHAGAAGFRKIGGRRAQAISFLNLAWQWHTGSDGRLREVRLAMGAVAPTVVRLTAAERVLEGGRLSPELIEAAAASVDSDINPIDDLRASADYRRRCARGLLREVLIDATPTLKENIS